MNKKITRFVTVAWYILVLMGLVSYVNHANAETIPSFPMGLFGSVVVNQSLAPIGSVVSAYYGDKKTGEITVVAEGVYGEDNLIGRKLIIPEGEGVISFSIKHPTIQGGVELFGGSDVFYSSFESGATVQKDLLFVVNQQTQTTNSGGSGGGGGGGGGSSKSSSAPPKKEINADENNDGKVNILDFNALMIHWGNVSGADFDNNGIVDILDFNLLMIYWSYE